MMVEVVARYQQGGISQRALADEYGIGQNTVSRWVRGIRADAVKLAVAS
jgi:transposase-like protein